jgi:D-sedoheptulose 7-phosphate isomerase
MQSELLKEISEILIQIPKEGLSKFVELLLENCETNRIWIIGNGGSSACASHFTSDLSSLGFNTTCLSDNVPRLTAITNDYGWEDVYIKQLMPIKAEDILITISVHGGADNWSNNLVKATLFAKNRNAKTLSLSGFDGGKLAQICDLSIIVPSERTFQIEGIHSILIHVICQILEEKHCNK